MVSRLERRRRRRMTAAMFLATAVPVLQSQSSRPLEWHLEQQPASSPCGSEDIAFVNAPEQVLLEKSYGLQPDFPYWKCESIATPALNEARVLVVYRLSIIDDGEGFTLIMPRGATSARLIRLSGPMDPRRGEEDLHNQAAMNAILMTKNYGTGSTIDWLGLCLAYLTMLDDAPNLADKLYAPGRADAPFKPYTVPGFMRELPALNRKHLVPKLTCDQNNQCTVHFYYRTEPVEPLKVADFVFLLQDGALTLSQANVHNSRKMKNAREY